MEETNSGDVADGVGFNANLLLSTENISQYIFDNVYNYKNW